MAELQLAKNLLPKLPYTCSTVAAGVSFVRLLLFAAG